MVKFDHGRPDGALALKDHLEAVGLALRINGTPPEEYASNIINSFGVGTTLAGIVEKDLRKYHRDRHAHFATLSKIVTSHYPSSNLARDVEDQLTNACQGATETSTIWGARLGKYLQAQGSTLDHAPSRARFVEGLRPSIKEMTEKKIETWRGSSPSAPAPTWHQVVQAAAEAEAALYLRERKTVATKLGSENAKDRASQEPASHASSYNSNRNYKSGRRHEDSRKRKRHSSSAAYNRTTEFDEEKEKIRVQIDHDSDKPPKTRDNSLYCQKCEMKGHSDAKCWEQHPELRPAWYLPRIPKKDKSHKNNEKKHEGLENIICDAIFFMSLQVQVEPARRRLRLMDSVKVYITLNDKKRVLALCDSGSSNSIIAPNVKSEMKLAIQNENLNAHLVDPTITIKGALTEDVVLRCGPYSKITNLFVPEINQLPEDIDMILGLNDLMGLKLLTWHLPEQEQANTPDKFANFRLLDEEITPTKHF
jgi:hypothetical protein